MMLLYFNEMNTTFKKNLKTKQNLKKSHPTVIIIPAE